MALIEKIIRIIIVIGLAVLMVLAIKDNDWTEGIFWLLTLAFVTYLPSIVEKRNYRK